MSASTKRREKLLADAATRFAELSSPFEPEWLSAHGVTLDECGDLSEDIARAIRLYLRTPAPERLALAFHDVMVESGMPEELATMGADGLRMADLTERIKKVRVR